MKLNYTLLLLFLAITIKQAAGQNVGIGTPSPHSSARLEIYAGNKGILLPRVSLASLEDTSLVKSPANGLLLFNTNSNLPGGRGFYYNEGNESSPSWIKLVDDTTGAWSLSGNRFTDLTRHFIGTIDDQPLRFRVSNVSAGLLDTASKSTFWGAAAGRAHNFSTGSNIQNTGIGYQALYNNPGTFNTAVGAYALKNTTSTGAYNCAVGTQALLSNTHGSQNVAAGANAMRANASGDFNVAIGDSALAFPTTGDKNVAIGARALKSSAISNMTGSTAVGYGALENSKVGVNVAVGYLAMNKNTGGWENVAVGYASMLSNISGYRNAAFGYDALASNITGFRNTALGYFALAANESGEENVAIGAGALSDNETDNNIGIGSNALNKNINGSRNIAIGKDALATMSYTNSGIPFAGDNIAIGTEALYKNQPNASLNLLATNGINNIALGSFALGSNTTGYNNVAVGYGNLRDNTVGYQNNAIGKESMLFNTSGNSNVAFGTSALRNNTSADNNVAIGNSSLSANTTGSFNTALGQGAGGFNSGNNYCTFLGFDADQASSTDYSNSTAIGSLTRISASNQVRIGNSAVSSIGGYEAWSNLSDGRFKTNIRDEVKGLEFIMALHPVTYNFDVNKLSAYLKEDLYKNDLGKVAVKKIDPLIKQQRDQKSMVLHTGFIAQEVEAAAKKIGYDFSGVDKPENSNDLYALRYAEFVVPLVKGMQEQQQEISNLKAQIEKLEAVLQKIQAK